jgi:hypothetical protein
MSNLRRTASLSSLERAGRWSLDLAPLTACAYPQGLIMAVGEWRAISALLRRVREVVR